ncbi:site-2 protease family protein [Oscillatoria sp. FACHB-1407]|uniref:site-2 protease family protein n=1 Tax=Oscillatoria sp. FACHB-1407 TaxID=2692847 RepID=UPI001688C263|nr:site-2 protease family protein [Oscillatoria sp. FACHB-1407]MBD2459792.1 site-2 protease family protein [Oscillatoria sp. FACHB-1407]
MKLGWRIGSIFGIPLFIDISWFYILALITLWYGGWVWRDRDWSTSVTWIAGLVMALLLFTSAVLHELGHSLVARSHGIPVNSITLFLFGGIAAIDQDEFKTPHQTFQVAIAGPTVSFVLFLLFILTVRLLAFSDPTATILEELAWLNLVLALFNMIPGLPLDGGQVLRAAIWQLTGNHLKSIRWAARIGQALGWIAIFSCAIGFLTSSNLWYLWIAFLGWFVVRNATTYMQVSDLQEALIQLHASTAMTRDFRVIDAHLSINEFTQNYLSRETASPLFFAVSDGRYRGMIDVNQLRHLEKSHWDSPVEAIAHPLNDIPTVTEMTSLAMVINLLETHQLRSIPVLSSAGSIAGVIDRGDIVRAVSERLNIAISDTTITRVKDDDTYPPGLPLSSIAKSLAK